MSLLLILRGECHNIENRYDPPNPHISPRGGYGDAAPTKGGQFKKGGFFILCRGNPEVVAPIPETPVVAPIPETPVVAPIPETPVVAPIPETPVVAPIPETPVVAPIPETPVVALVDGAWLSRGPDSDKILSFLRTVLIRGLIIFVCLGFPLHFDKNFL